MFMCCLKGSTLHSLCRCWTGVLRVQPVAMRRAAFCFFCKVLWCVRARPGVHTGHAYSMTGLTYCLYRAVTDSFEFPKVVPITALSTPSLDLALTDTSWTCGLNVIPLSRVTPMTCRVFSTGIGMPLSVTRGWVAYSLVSGVTSVRTHLPGSTSILLIASQSSNCPM